MGQEGGTSTRPEVTRKKSGGFFQSSNEPKTSKKKEARGTIHFNNINLNSTANIKAPLGSGKGHQRNQTLPPNPQLNLPLTQKNEQPIPPPHGLNESNSRSDDR